jgi:hypothetical protein
MRACIPIEQMSPRVRSISDLWTSYSFSPSALRLDEEIRGARDDQRHPRDEEQVDPPEVLAEEKFHGPAAG